MHKTIIQYSVHNNIKMYVYIINSTVEPRHKKAGYNKTLLQQGNPAGPALHTSLFLYPDTMRKPLQGNPHDPKVLVTTRPHCTTRIISIVYNLQQCIISHLVYSADRALALKTKTMWTNGALFITQQLILRDAAPWSETFLLFQGSLGSKK